MTSRSVWLLAPLAALELACASNSTTILSEPPGAHVYVDEAWVGETPVTIRLQMRTHRIRLEKDGFDPLTDYLAVHERASFMTWYLLMASLGDYDAKYAFQDSYRFELVPKALP